MLVNLGTPDAPTRGAVYRYLKEFLLDPRVIDVPAIPRNILVRGIIAPFRSGKSAEAYQELWTEKGSPLKVYGYSLSQLVQEQLGDNYVTALAMRYQSPSIRAGLEYLREQEVDKYIIFPLFPQYASATTGSVHEEVMRVMSTWQIIPPTIFVQDYYDNPGIIDAFIEQAKEQKPESYDHILFSFHGLPKRQMRKGDRSGEHCQRVPNCCETLSLKNRSCYSAQCYATARAIAEKLGIGKEKYSICFQSRLGRDPWLEPYTSDMLKVRYDAGDRRLLVFCPAFVADCLETTVEISDEYAEEFEEMGGEHLGLVPGLNDHPRWVEALCDIVRSYT